MTDMFLVTVETPAGIPDSRREEIRVEIEAHAGACVEFYGRVKPDLVKCEQVTHCERLTIVEPWRKS